MTWRSPPTARLWPRRMLRLVSFRKSSASPKGSIVLSLPRLGQQAAQDTVLPRRSAYSMCHNILCVFSRRDDRLTIFILGCFDVHPFRTGRGLRDGESRPPYVSLRMAARDRRGPVFQKEHHSGHGSNLIGSGCLPVMEDETPS
jgi:hypothetical protein